MILKQIYPPTMMKDLEASSQDAIIELAEAFPYQPSAGATGLNRFQQVIPDDFCGSRSELPTESRSEGLDRFQQVTSNAISAAPH